MPSIRLINISFVVFVVLSFEKISDCKTERIKAFWSTYHSLKIQLPLSTNKFPLQQKIPPFFFGLHRKRWTQLPVSLAILDAGHRSKSRQGCYRGCSNHRNLVILAAFLGGSRAVDVSTGGYMWYVYTNVFYSVNTTNCSSLKIEILKSSWDNFGIHAIGSRLIDSSTTCTDIKSKNAKDWMDWNASDQIRIRMLHPRVNEPTKHNEMSGGFYTIWSEASWLPKSRMPMWPYNDLIWVGT